MSLSIRWFIRFCSVAILIASPALSPLFAQSQASCSFDIFQLPSDLDEVYGVNDFKSVVGKAEFSSTQTPQKGFIRYSGGGVSYYLVPNSFVTYLTGRNNNGTSVGVYTTKSADTIAKGFMLSGSTVTSIVHPNAVWGTTVTGINKYNSIVGWYADANENSHGFRRNTDGSFTDLNYPGSKNGTAANGINDAGAIVGGYNGNGFIFHNGSWATLNYPGGSTQLLGISNSGVIVGVSSATEQGVSFLYADGAFKVIEVPNSFATLVAGISPGGLIVGNVNLNGNQSGWRGFTATCH